MDGDRGLLAEQCAYYRAAAAEYDRPYAERRELRDLLASAAELPVSGDVVELACGTGQWTALLAARARSVTALDASAEVLELARLRAAAPHVRFERADVFAWRPARRYDTVFFAFWLSHVPPALLPAFWERVAAALAPGGRAVFVDDGPEAAAREEVLEGQAVPAVVRRLDDGSRHRVVKVFHDAVGLADQLARLGWSARIRPVGAQFIGVAELRADAASFPTGAACWEVSRPGPP
ncbi:class I SAM-dependent methyltransferase [Streptomyces sp. ODS28]|uniref:class I SAM-dependent methyltransferase n=1 Tax=Streptomyces sp. ODS28 TaxID=3136688 RepID=UPI0031F01BF5